ncbi:MAG: DUF3574 domain-containing protein [Acidobacteria bacterium]|nr:DUF3574 domain-containing protein [Acidobacteriota bacterium]
MTSWEASGQWQGANGVIEREASHRTFGLRKSRP